MSHIERVKPAPEQMDASRRAVRAVHPEARSYYTDDGAGISASDFGEAIAEVKGSDWAVEYAWMAAAEKISTGERHKFGVLA